MPTTGGLKSCKRRSSKRKCSVKYKADFVFIDSERVSWFLKHYSGVTKSGRDVLILIRNNGELEERYDAKVSVGKNQK